MFEWLAFVGRKCRRSSPIRIEWGSKGAFTWYGPGLENGQLCGGARMGVIAGAGWMKWEDVGLHDGGRIWVRLGNGRQDAICL